MLDRNILYVKRIWFSDVKSVMEFSASGPWVVWPRWLTSKCGWAPWAAPLNWTQAERLQNAELSWRWTFGSILVCVARFTA